jgi:probable HAF family extracellular repeat protein
MTATGLLPAGTSVTFETLGDLPGGEYGSIAINVSADGSVVVGHSITAEGSEAFRWEDGSMAGLGGLPGGTFFSIAQQSSIPQGIGDLPGGKFESYLLGVSGDGLGDQ